MMKKDSDDSGILRVERTGEQARRYYDRLSRFYDWFGAFERKHAETALMCLAVKEGEAVLEIGCGTGHALEWLAKAVGSTGKVYGIDLSSGMLRVAGKRLSKSGLSERVELYSGDALQLPFTGGMFDAVFLSFTLELFDTPEIPDVLAEVKRVLKPGGRLGVIGMSKTKGNLLPLRLYEWGHRKWPVYIDCRPIFIEQAVTASGFEIREKKVVKLISLPCEIVIAYR